MQKDLDTWMQKEKEAQEKMDEDAKKMEKWATKENLLTQKMDECTEKIAGLGALPVRTFWFNLNQITNRSINLIYFRGSILCTRK
jgi:structural maintenance of chromosome 3 (chondroitin sulfate proteoglycan 6)